ncbi:MAG: UPF0158 family protein, partial [Promethearchaeia archaeon]
EAYKFSSSERSYYLDTETGKVLLIVHRTRVVEQNRKNKKKVEQDDEGRYVEVPSRDSREGYRDMQDFILTVEDEGRKEKLRIAIYGRGAFRRFKDVLRELSDMREKWFEFKERRIKEGV